MDELFGFIALIVSLFFFVWFHATLTSIKRHLERVADHAERQTKLLASIAKSPSEDSTPVPTSGRNQ
jgi:hypothetical protein